MYIQTYNLCIILSFQQVHDYTKIINSYLTHTYRLIKQCETIGAFITLTQVMDYSLNPPALQDLVVKQLLN